MATSHGCCPPAFPCLTCSTLMQMLARLRWRAPEQKCMQANRHGQNSMQKILWKAGASCKCLCVSGLSYPMMTPSGQHPL